MRNRSARYMRVFVSQSADWISLVSAVCMQKADYVAHLHDLYIIFMNRISLNWLQNVYVSML